MKPNISNKVDKNIAVYSGDLNNIKETGFVYSSGTGTNTPQKGYSWFVTTIALNSNYVIQKADRADSDIPISYERQCRAGVWTEWEQTSPVNIITGVEFKTGRIIDGKVEYGKRIDCGYLPDGSGVKEVAHGLKVSMITKIEAIAHSSSYTRWTTLPLVENGASSAYNVSINANGTNIVLNCDNSQSHYRAYVTLYYLKD